MTTSNKNLHLTDDERRIIQRGIENNSSKKSIADTLGKDKSTIGKEIKNHRTLSYKLKYPVECIDAGNVQTNIHTIVLGNALPSGLSSVKDVPALLAHATAAKDTSAAGSTSTSMKRMLHRKNMLKCSVMHVPVSTLHSMKSEI
ncbi:helix-turn-helix domain-containing protein [Bulleidia sp. HCP3S3_F2]